MLSPAFADTGNTRNRMSVLPRAERAVLPAAGRKVICVCPWSLYPRSLSICRTGRDGRHSMDVRYVHTQLVEVRGVEPLS